MAKRFLLSLLGLAFLLNLVLGGYYFYLRYQKTKFVCPVPKEYCKTAKVIEIEGRYFGLGYKVPEGTPIYAVRNGFLDKGFFGLNPKYGGGNYPVLLLETGNDEAIDYIHTGSESQLKVDVAGGGQIGVAGKSDISNLGVNVVIRQVKAGKMVELKKI